MTRVFNFSAGPSTFPISVLEQARDELCEWRNTGMSIMEMSHRSHDYLSVAEEAEADLRELLAIPTHYKVLFLQGGATGQFSAIPMNLLGNKTLCSYVNTGIWSQKALAEAKRFAKVQESASAQKDNFTTIPDLTSWDVDPNSAYLHYTSNETIGGVEFQLTPDLFNIPLVSDMSSNILSRPIDVEKFGLIYAGAQKNMGPSGITIVIVRDDLIGQAHERTPPIIDDKIQADNGSMLNTPPTYNWYLLGLVLKWVKAQGGIEAVEAINIRKANKLYRVIDESDFYSNPVDPRYRSRMNVPFRFHEQTLETHFIEGAKQAGLVNLEGHRSVGGFRASIYNAMPESGVDALIHYMQDFAKAHG